MSAVELSVRPARLGDGREIERVRAASWQAVYGHVLPAETFENWDYDEYVARREQSIRTTNPYAVVDSPIRTDRLAGFISFGPSRDEDLAGWAEVFALYARPVSLPTARSAPSKTLNYPAVSHYPRSDCTGRSQQVSCFP